MLTSTIDLNYNPPWDWIGNAGRGVWKGVWRKDRRSDVFGSLVIRCSEDFLNDPDLNETG